MAIQNFLSGGFYGKLGDVVGQRWHNKRVVRAYVIPYNPRTEKQQANRQLFALATVLAQQAYNFNKGSPLWDTSQMGQFSQMVSLAKRRLQAGMSPSQALPLYPEGHVSNVTLSNPTAHWDSWPGAVMIRDDSYAFAEARAMNIIVQAFDERQNQWAFFNDTVGFSPGSAFAYAFNPDNRYSLPPGSAIQALTDDDASFNGASIQLPAFSIAQPSKALLHITPSFDAPVYAVEGDELKITVEIDLLGKDFNWEANFHYHDTDSGTWGDGSSAFYVRASGLLDLYAPLDDIDYPPGAYLWPVDYAYQGCQNAVIRISWPQFNFTWP